MFHVKDAEFNPTGKSGVYGGYQDWIDRPGRFRSLGDGQIDFKTIFEDYFRELVRKHSIFFSNELSRCVDRLLLNRKNSPLLTKYLQFR